jgi:hypothetical protein
MTDRGGGWAGLGLAWPEHTRSARLGRSSRNGSGMSAMPVSSSVGGYDPDRHSCLLRFNVLPELDPESQPCWPGRFPGVRMRRRDRVAIAEKAVVRDAELGAGNLPAYKITGIDAGRFAQSQPPRNADTNLR